jgi:hypothetical protein
MAVAFALAVAAAMWVGHARPVWVEVAWVACIAAAEAFSFLFLRTTAGATTFSGLFLTACVALHLYCTHVAYPLIELATGLHIVGVAVAAWGVLVLLEVPAVAHGWVGRDAPRLWASAVYGMQDDEGRELPPWWSVLLAPTHRMQSAASGPPLSPEAVPAPDGVMRVPNPLAAGPAGRATAPEWGATAAAVARRRRSTSTSPASAPGAEAGRGDGGGQPTLVVTGNPLHTAGPAR